MNWAWQISSASGLFLLGLIWTVHLALYPLFRQVAAECWPAYHAQHARRMGWVVAPVMLAELIATVALCFDGSLPLALRLMLIGLVVTNWLTTGLGAVPLHQKLEQRPEPALIGRLLVVNRGRLVAWSLKALLMLGWGAL
ncbi:MAG: hypothetical protein Q7P63_00380 [Verrucomicrobiota bacterium JB022]|nr:hypothetical protein [Verrucomicrobiota bacterium JB022]